MVKGKESKFELAGNSSYPSSSYRGSTVAKIEQKARGERWEERTYLEERPGGISSWTIPDKASLKHQTNSGRRLRSWSARISVY